METLTRAHHEMFRRSPDERYPSLQQLWEHCHRVKEESQTLWCPPGDLLPEAANGHVGLAANGEPFQLNDWSFSQLCRLANVHRDTVNKLSSKTAGAVFTETLPKSGRPHQVHTLDKTIRSIHGVAYTRLYNADVLDLALEFATDFEAPQKGTNGGTGLYCGEQDMFCFLIDPLGWIEIEGQPFAPGFFLWNSEVGRRTVGIQTFWFQAICQNHIVWDAVDITEFTRKHTANVHEALDAIRRILVTLNDKRDQRKDGFAQVMRNAMNTTLGADEDEVLKILAARDVPRVLAKEALELAQSQGAFTVYAVLEALTRLSQRIQFAGDRTHADIRASQLLALAA